MVKLENNTGSILELEENEVGAGNKEAESVLCWAGLQKEGQGWINI